MFLNLRGIRVVMVPEVSPEVSAEAVERLLAANKGSVLLDVRTKAEWSALHLDMPQARLLPLHEITPERIDELFPDKSTFIATSCRTGRRACEAAEKLKEMGYGRVVVVKNGLAGWTEMQSKRGAFTVEELARRRTILALHPDEFPENEGLEF